MGRFTTDEKIVIAALIVCLLTIVLFVVLLCTGHITFLINRLTL